MDSTPPGSAGAPGRLRTAARIVVGLACGLLGGVAVVLGLLAYGATIDAVFLHEWTELIGWRGLPVVLGPALMVTAAVRSRPGRFWRQVAAGLAALVAGAAVGAALGSALGSRPTDPWSWSYMGAGGAVTVFAGAALSVSAARRLVGRSGANGWAGWAVAIVLAAAAAGCGSDAEGIPTVARVGPVPDSTEVAAVVFLLGDPGLARTETSPLLGRLRRDVEHWSDAVGPEGRIVMLVLGDIVYPAGLNAPSHPERAGDSLVIASQVGVVEGPAARAAGARVIFIPGNHDWGEKEDVEGAVRLVRLQDLLDGWAGPAAGRLAVEPAPGTGGPTILDLGPRLRLIILDTAWWLLRSDPAAKDAVIDSVRGALASADGRRVVVAAHHPLESAGPHGAGAWLGSVLGLRTLLNKGGILLQDLSSRPYADLKGRLLDAFDEAGHPDVFAGGHEHSLQVFAPDGGGATRGLVVGSGSKLTGVAHAPGMLFGRSEPGYGKIVILRDGSLYVVLEAAPDRFLSCEGARRAACMDEGVEAFRTVWREEVPVSASGGSPGP